MNDPKAKAANDTTNAEQAPTLAFTEAQVVAAAIVILNSFAVDGEPILNILKPPMEIQEISPPELVVAAIEHLREKKALGLVGDLASITAFGWRYLVTAKDGLAKIEIGKKDDELRAYKDRISEEHRLVQMVRSRESSVEAAKAGVTAAKERLEEALTQMTAFLSGPVQTTIEEKGEPTGDMTAYEQGASAFNRGIAFDTCAYEADSEAWADWRRGWKLARMGTVEERDAKKLGLTGDQLAGFLLEDGALTVGEKAPNIGNIVVEALERSHLVIDAVDLDPADAGSPTKFLLLPIYSVEEWQQLCESDYGRAVDGFDQNEDAKAKRTVGGIDCGRVVKLGRKKGVVGPLKHAVVVKVVIEN